MTGAIAEAGGCGCHWRCAEGAGDWASSMLGLVVCSVNGDHWHHHQNAAGVKRKKKLTFWGRWRQYVGVIIVGAVLRVLVTVGVIDVGAGSVLCRW